MADKFTRRINNGGQQIRKLQRLIADIKSSVTSKNTDKEWRKAYNQVQALILTLSDDFEEPYDSWTYSDNSERLDKITKELVQLVASVLLHPPSKATKEVVDKNMAFLRGHLKAGSFTQYVDDEDFAKCYPKVVESYKKLVGQDDVDDDEVED